MADDRPEDHGPHGRTDRNDRHVQGRTRRFSRSSDYDYDTLHTRLREAGVPERRRAHHADATSATGRNAPARRICYEGGIRSFVDHIHQKRQLEVLHPDVIYLKGQLERLHRRSGAMQYNDSYNELILSFANNINTTGRRHP